MIRTVHQVLLGLQSSGSITCATPSYTGNRKCPRVLMGCSQMKTHMTSEGWQLQLGLQKTGYDLAGPELFHDYKDTQTILDKLDPGVLVLQDKREWDARTANCDQEKHAWMRFDNIQALKDREDIFKLTILKDAHSSPPYHRESAEEIGAHGWITYYNTNIVKHVSGFVRPEHCVQTTHCIDTNEVPAFLSGKKRFGTVLSGAMNPRYYPLRCELSNKRSHIPGMVCINHPGYGHKFCHTPKYLKRLSKFKVAIATSSCFGYFLRKIIEATCVGCRVITDLPVDEVYPIIEENLVRVGSFKEVKDILPQLYSSYNDEYQEDLALRATEYYSYQSVGRRLATDIEELRKNYAKSNQSNSDRRKRSVSGSV